MGGEEESESCLNLVLPPLPMTLLSPSICSAMHYQPHSCQQALFCSLLSAGPLQAYGNGLEVQCMLPDCLL